MTISREGRLRIVSEDGTGVTTTVTDEKGAAVRCAGLTLAVDDGLWRAKVEVYAPTLDIFTDAELRIYTMEMLALMTHLETLAQFIESLPAEVRAGVGDKLVDHAHRVAELRARQIAERQLAEMRAGDGE